MTTMKMPRPSRSDRLTVATAVVSRPEWSLRTRAPRGSRPDDQLAVTAPVPARGSIPPGGVQPESDRPAVADAVVEPPG